MPYKVQFVGLVCFYRENGGRRALLPDGRDPGDAIDPHFATINVARDAIEESSGWNGEADFSHGIFQLEPCDISIEGSDVSGSLDTLDHDDKLPQLRRLDPNFEIDPDRAQTIARLRIRNGKLTAYTVPQGTAIISQLDVPHDGPINVIVTPRDGSPQKILRLKAGTEVAIANTARGYQGDQSESGHFRIYEKLSSNPVRLADPTFEPAVPPSPSRHAIFKRAMPVNLNTNCSNTGCC